MIRRYQHNLNDSPIAMLSSYHRSEFPGSTVYCLGRWNSRKVQRIQIYFSPWWEHAAPYRLCCRINLDQLLMITNYEFLNLFQIINLSKRINVGTISKIVSILQFSQTMWKQDFFRLFWRFNTSVIPSCSTKVKKYLKIAG